MIQKIKNIDWKQILANIILGIIVIIILFFIGLSAYGDYLMQEKIMAIPSDGNMNTIGR